MERHRLGSSRHRGADGDRLGGRVRQCGPARAINPGARGLQGGERSEASGDDLQGRRVAAHPLHLAQGCSGDVSGGPGLRPHRHHQPERLPRRRPRRAAKPAAVGGLSRVRLRGTRGLRAEDRRHLQRAGRRPAPEPARLLHRHHRRAARRHAPPRADRCSVSRHRVEVQGPRLGALVLVGRSAHGSGQSAQDLRRSAGAGGGVARHRAFLSPLRMVLALPQRLLATLAVQCPAHARISWRLEPVARRSLQPAGDARPAR